MILETLNKKRFANVPISLESGETKKDKELDERLSALEQEVKLMSRLLGKLAMTQILEKTEESRKMPEPEETRDIQGYSLLGVLCTLGYAASHGEARRHVKAGNVKINDRTITDEAYYFVEEDFADLLSLPKLPILITVGSCEQFILNYDQFKAKKVGDHKRFQGERQ